MKKILLGILGALALAGGGVWFLNRGAAVPAPDSETAQSGEVVPAVRPKKPARGKSVVRTPAPSAATSTAAEAPVETEESAPMSEEEKREAAEEKLVETFDAETDRWMDTEKTKPPTMDEVEKFHALFKALPKDRKEECLHRALNLVPDANVMLLAGILMDKSEDKELVELVFNDVLNRGEDVKKPILRQVFSDKTHPCWADTAWIFDVTGETPRKK